VTGYPPDWPRCACGAPVLDGHLTCGAAGCDEARARARRAEDQAVAVWLGAELIALEPMELGLKPESVFTLVGLVQLALRHPDLPAGPRAFGEQFVGAARAYFTGCPTVLDVIRKGDDPDYDVRPRGSVG
jgi:hypothetical protein